MSDIKNACGCVKGVGCDVQSCKYHDGNGNCCTASHINVQNKSAQNKDETFCGTFTPRGFC